MRTKFSRGIAALAVLGVFAAVLAIPKPAAAATDWSLQSVNTAVALNDIDFGDTRNGLAVGLAGQAFRTTDGGAKWEALNTGSNEAFFAGFLIPGFCGPSGARTDCIWLGGTNGTILFSSDSGKTWCTQQTDTTATILGFDAAGPNDIIAVGTGGTILRSGNRGTNGTKCGADGKYDKLASGTTATLRDVDAAAGGNAYAVGDNGTILEIIMSATEPDQANVNKVAAVASGTTTNLHGVAVFGTDTTNNIWVAGDNGTIRRGTDPYGLANSSSTTFSAQPSGTTQTLRDIEVDQNNGTTLIAVGDLGTIRRTTNGGTSWGAVTAPTCQNLSSAAFGYNDDGSSQQWASGDRGTIVTSVPDANATASNCSEASTGANGYRMVAGDGGIFTFGKRGFHGSTGDRVLNKPIVGGATDLSDYEGYWIVASDGGVFAFSADFHGSLGGQAIPSPAVEIEPTPTGKGYWIVLANGKVYPFGDAKHHGDLTTQNITANQAIIGMSVTPSGLGYWLVGKDGGIFSYGDARFFGSTGSMKLNAPVIDLAPVPDGQGYFLVAEDGGVFTFGSAEFKGSTGSMKLNRPVIAMLVSPSGTGYWLAATDGGVFTFGAIEFLGSMGNTRLNSPVLDLIN